MKIANIWIKETEKEEHKTTLEDVKERLPLREKLHNSAGFQVKLKNKPLLFGLRKDERTSRANEGSVGEKEEGREETNKMNIVFLFLFLLFLLE